ncbi:hypothetical protein [Mesorhizobium sp.]|nr:hypothetical protein [Mesorhizobium sp.]
MAASLAADTITKRRISWAELYKLRPDLAPPANDNDKADESGKRKVAA